MYILELAKWKTKLKEKIPKPKPYRDFEVENCLEMCVFLLRVVFHLMSALAAVLLDHPHQDHTPAVRSFFRLVKLPSLILLHPLVTLTSLVNPLAVISL